MERDGQTEVYRDMVFPARERSSEPQGLEDVYLEVGRLYETCRGNRQPARSVDLEIGDPFTEFNYESFVYDAHRQKRIQLASLICYVCCAGSLLAALARPLYMSLSWIV